MKHIVAVASGKGGVGKSTIAANIALALAKSSPANEGKIALIDLDFYGPSIPTLLGGGEVKSDETGLLIPAERWGVKYISIGFFLRNPDDPIIWRGPMFTKAIEQLFRDVAWGEIDYCLVDMPPGTGDAQLSLAQLVQLDGAVVVTTPQEVAVADVRRAITMFGKVNVPVLGVVENMSGFRAPTGEVYDIFGSGGGEELARSYNLPLLGKIPLEPAIRQGGDDGKPAALEGGEAGKLFSDLALRLTEVIQQAAQKRPTVVVE